MKLLLKGKTVILGVSGSISAYKAPLLVSLLLKAHCNVHVILTKSGAEFISPVVFETLTGNKCIIDMFDKNSHGAEHIYLAKQADLFIISPASADIIAKVANGIADDMLSSTILACTCKKLIAPAMNTNMYKNPITQDNIEKLKKYGFEIITPSTGLLACKDIGEGKLPEADVIFEYILKELAFEKDLKGKKVIVTAGATSEAIDPVRYITNHSTGKMGYALAKACMLRGADVTLISGKTALKPPMFINTIEVTSAEDMFIEVSKHFPDCDFIFKSAAVADYTPKEVFSNKVKKKDDDITISLKRTKDILKYLGENKKDNQYICGFSMETENLIENSKEKLLRKNADMIVANNLKTEGAGFGTDTNVATLITKDKIVELEKMTKEELSHKIIDEVLK